MDSFIAYHVVTEQPLVQGQRIVFDDTHHNGVYHRVMTFQKIINGENVTGNLADMIRANMDKWSKVSYRELALEHVRKKEFPQYPSRMACLYTSQTFAEAKTWATFFEDIGRKVFSIVRLRVNGRFFLCDACNCFDGGEDELENLLKARQYWKMNEKHKNPVIEMLVDGEIVVEEIIIQY